MKDPARSIEDASLPDSFRSALAAHVGDRPNAERMARMASNLEQALGMPLTAATLPPAAPSLAMRLAKGWPWLGLGAALIGVGVWWSSVAQPHVVPPAAPAAATPPPAAAPVSVEPPAIVADPAPSAPQPERPVIAPASKLPKSRALSARREPAIDTTSSDPAAELALLQRAQQQLTAAPARALSLAAEHQRRYPDGVFRQERELIAIVALLRRGQLTDAQTRAARFRSTFPNSVHRSRLESLMQGDNPRAVLAPMSGKENASW